MVRYYVESSGISIHPSGINGNLLTVAQVARLLNAHPHSVRRWADSGLLPCYRIGVRGDRRFSPDDIDQFLVARNNGHPAGQMTGLNLNHLDRFNLQAQKILVNED